MFFLLYLSEILSKATNHSSGVMVDMTFSVTDKVVGFKPKMNEAIYGAMA